MGINLNGNIHILVVEDDIDINNLLYKILVRNGYNVTCAYSGTEAKMCFEQFDFKLVLLDLMIPGINGEEFIKYVRGQNTVPIIVISAKPGQETKINALKLGADDFVSKPFDVNEVIARVEAQLRRYMRFSANYREEELKFKNLTLDTESLKVMVFNNEILLTAKEFAILRMLMENENKVFTKENIYADVWNDEFIGDDKTVNVHISNIRSKIAKYDPDNEYIHTVWGIGFKMGN